LTGTEETVSIKIQTVPFREGAVSEHPSVNRWYSFRTIPISYLLGLITGGSICFFLGIRWNNDWRAESRAMETRRLELTSDTCHAFIASAQVPYLLMAEQDDMPLSDERTDTLTDVLRIYARALKLCAKALDSTPLFSPECMSMTEEIGVRAATLPSSAPEARERLKEVRLVVRDCFFSERQ
jgi:hypothetical protein